MKMSIISPRMPNVLANLSDVPKRLCATHNNRFHYCTIFPVIRNYFWSIDIHYPPPVDGPQRHKVISFPVNEDARILRVLFGRYYCIRNSFKVTHVMDIQWTLVPFSRRHVARGVGLETVAPSKMWVLKSNYEKVKSNESLFKNEKEPLFLLQFIILVKIYITVYSIKLTI